MENRPWKNCASDSFDLVLLDIEMPEMNGYQVLETCLQDSELRDIPIIMTSSLDEIDSVVKCVELGAEDYLNKPVNPDSVAGTRECQPGKETPAR